MNEFSLCLLLIGLSCAVVGDFGMFILHCAPGRLPPDSPQFSNYRALTRIGQSLVILSLILKVWLV